MTCLALIQARMSSTRLPGKVLEDVGGLPLLGWVIRAMKASQRVDAVVVATTTNNTDDDVATFAQNAGAGVARGSELDVLDRFYQAARNSSHVIRVTADCPFLDPALVDACFELCVDNGFDYTSVGEEGGFPRGLDVEVMLRSALDAAWSEASAPHDRSHVTSFIYAHPERFRLGRVNAQIPVKGRWTVDTVDDMSFARAVARYLPSDRPPAWTEIVQLLRRHPTLQNINAHVRQKTLEEG
jgi:spore coat polysaccharide biosynthesis protein SpsF